MNPVTDLVKAVFFPFKAVFVVALCWFINAMTSPDEHWWHWVAFGMTIAAIVKLMRGLRALVVAGGVAGLGYLVFRWWTRRHVDRTEATRGVVVDV